MITDENIMRFLKSLSMDDDGYVTNEVHQQLQDILTGIGKAKKKVINLLDFYRVNLQRRVARAILLSYKIMALSVKTVPRFL